MEEMVEVYEETDEKLKAYLEKDASVEDLLEDKINDLNSEKQNLSNKYTELKKLESSHRDKLTRDASTDEIRKIADDIDKVKEEVTGIQSNIEALESDINKITTTKKQTEESKENYIANVSKTIAEYEKKLEAINKAIEVCNNDSLKEAFEEEQTKMQNELNALKSKREEELDKAVELTINNSDESNEEDTTKIEEVKVPKSNFEEVIVSNLLSPNNEEDNNINTNIEEVKVNEDQIDNNKEAEVEFNKIEEKLPELTNEQKNEKISMNEPSIKIDQDLINRLVEEELMKQGLINQPEKTEDISSSDSLSNNSINIEENADTELEVETTPLIVPDIDLSNFDLQNTKIKEETNGKMIIDNSFVDASKISQILESSGVMPGVYKWLDSNINENEKVVE